MWVCKSPELATRGRPEVPRGDLQAKKTWKFPNDVDGVWGQNVSIHQETLLIRLVRSLKLTFSPLKMDGWNTTFLLGRPIFRCELLVFGGVGFFCQPW